MTKAARSLLTANDLARYCQVDLKTIHNWAEKRVLAHHRTPGRHLRFRRLDVVDFLKAYGYPVPESLRTRRTKVGVVHADSNVLVQVRRALSRRFDVATFADPIDALVDLAALDLDVLLLDVEVPAFDALRCITRLAGHTTTRHVRIVALGGEDTSREAVLAAGAAAFVRSLDPGDLRDALDRIVGSTPT